MDIFIVLAVIVIVALLGALVYLHMKVRKSIHEIRLDQEIIAEEVGQKVDNLSERYTQQYADIMGAIAGLKEDLSNSEPADERTEDELYEAAKEAVIEAGKASTSYIQRKLGVGYSRAAALMDELEDEGVIGPAKGSKPRLVVEEGET